MNSGHNLLKAHKSYITNEFRGKGVFRYSLFEKCWGEHMVVAPIFDACLFGLLILLFLTHFCLCRLS